MSASLTPPDRARCQAEKPNGNSFMTLGGRPGMVRCSNAPTVVATETAPGEDGRRGSMSLCADCRAVFERQMPAGYATFAPVASAEEALQALVDHMEKLRVVTLPLTEPTGPVDTALVESVGEAQRAETARYDAWMAEHGWTRAAVVELVREVHARVKAGEGKKRPRGRRR